VSNLPNGWVHAPLKSLLSSDGIFSDGDWIESKDQDPNGSIRLLQLADIGDGYFVDKSSRFVNEEKFAALNCTELKTGDVLIARMPDPLGRACLLPEMSQPCITVVDVAVFRTGKECASNKWLMNVINSPQLRTFMETNSSGTTRKRIARGKLTDMELHVPPINEQKRIADKLDAVLARVDSCRDRLDRLPLILKRFRQSVLAAATSGKLTETWRVFHHADSWQQTHLRELAILITKGASPNWQGISYVDAGAGATLFVTSQNVRDMRMDISEPKYVDSAFNQAQRRSVLQRGDLLTNIVGASIGRSAIYDSDELTNINQAVCLIRLKEDVERKFMLYVLSTPVTLEFMNLEKVDVARANLSLVDIGNVPVELPTRAEQTEIVRRVESLFAYADRLEARYTAARSQVEKLTPATIAKAFRGELVPQDPNDEPASVLLERIRTAHNSQLTNKPKRGHRKPG
jgi:type I restriction enzyme S subunit